MISNYVLLLILILMLFSLYNNFSILFNRVENFDSKDNCMKLGYTLDFCQNTPLKLKVRVTVQVVKDLMLDTTDVIVEHISNYLMHR